LLKLIDFGFSKKVQQGEKIHGYVGTEIYMPPEVRIKGNYYDGKAVDLFNATLVLLVIVTGNIYCFS